MENRFRESITGERYLRDHLEPTLESCMMNAAYAGVNCLYHPGLSEWKQIP